MLNTHKERLDRYRIETSKELTFQPKISESSKQKAKYSKHSMKKGVVQLKLSMDENDIHSRLYCTKRRAKIDIMRRKRELIEEVNFY